MFRQKWGSLHALSRARRFEALASLQPLTELQVSCCFSLKRHIAGGQAFACIVWLAVTTLPLPAASAADAATAADDTWPGKSACLLWLLHSPWVPVCSSSSSACSTAHCAKSCVDALFNSHLWSQEVLDLLDRLPAGSAGTAGVEALQRLVERWDKRWPSVQQPSADACLTVINVRQLLLNALLEEWPRAHQHQGRTVFQVCF